MGLEEEVRKVVSEGPRLEPAADSTNQLANVTRAVQELQGVVVRLAGEVERLQGG